MANDAKRSAGPQFSAGVLMTSAVLVGVGAVFAMAGLAVGGSHVVLATRRWVKQMDVPPSEVAKAKWAQAKAAAGAGATAWQGGRPAGPAGVS
ncbi:MAG: hypothetical protein ABSB01_07730 [Streptosporangiaceae bacterium]|jgi:hypothetical protein